MYKISVVTVTYNCESVLEETIKSVIDQTYPNIEYIIIDGASKDDTVNIIKRYEERITYWISKPDKGLYDAMNKGIDKATGDFVIFMNAGDCFYSNDTIDVFFKYVKNDTIIAYGDIINIAKGYNYRQSPAPLKEMINQMVVFHQGTFTNLSYHKEHFFSSKYKSAADYDFFYQAYTKDKVQFQYIPVCVAKFDCCHGTSNTNYRLSQRENMAIRGLDASSYQRIKKNLWFYSVDIKRWIKRHFLSQEQVRKIEIARLKRDGIKEIEITKF